MLQIDAVHSQGYRPPDGRAGFTIQGAADWSGLSRSALYRFAAQGRLTFRKAGRTTIVDGTSLAALVASLPPARIGTRDAA
jgi:hypothetical protein